MYLINNLMHEVIIIGAGPAGISAAIQLKRFGINSIVIEKNKFGGLINNANLIENYLGFPKGISGSYFVKKIKKQFKKHKIPIKYEEVIKVNFNKNFKIKTKKNTYNSRHLIIATGTKPKNLRNIENIRNKIYYEVLDLINVKNKKIAIIGSGDAAFDYALNLCKNNKISVFNRNDKVSALPILFKRSRKEKNIRLFNRLTLKSAENNKKNIILNFSNKYSDELDLMLIAIGRKPDKSLITKKLLNNNKLFIIGDVKNGILRQTSVACGDGLKAANEIYEKIRKK